MVRGVGWRVGPGCVPDSVTLSILLDTEARAGPGALDRCVARLRVAAVGGTELRPRAVAALVRAAVADLAAGHRSSTSAAALAAILPPAAPAFAPLAPWPSPTAVAARLIDAGAAVLLASPTRGGGGTSSSTAPADEADADGLLAAARGWAQLAHAAAAGGAPAAALAWAEALDARVRVVAAALRTRPDVRCELVVADLAMAMGATTLAHACLDRVVAAMSTPPPRRHRATVSVATLGALLGRMTMHPERRPAARQLYAAAKTHGLARPIPPSDALSLLAMLTDTPTCPRDLAWALELWRDAVAAAEADTHNDVAEDSPVPAATAAAVWVHSVLKVVPPPRAIVAYTRTHAAALAALAPTLAAALEASGEATLTDAVPRLRPPLLPHTMPSSQQPAVPPTSPQMRVAAPARRFVPVDAPPLYLRTVAALAS
jgi:hypothetical protein